jgi:hypothetical protein
MPLEKMMYGISKDERFTKSDEETARRMFIPIEAYPLIGSIAKSKNCTLLNDQVVINHDGSSPVCCGLYDPVFTVSENFLNTELSQLQQIRKSSEICGICMNNGLHDIAIQKPIELWNSLVRQEQTRIGTKFLTNVVNQPTLELNPKYTPTEQILK